MKNYEITDDKSKLQLDTIHAWLKEAYWCKGIPKATVAAAIENSLCFGIYRDNIQVGFGRVITDSTTFAWMCDVFIDEKHRGHGLGKELVKAIMHHPSLQGLRRICLATQDAHSLYEKFGFKVTTTPQSWMEMKNNQIYLHSESPNVPS